MPSRSKASKLEEPPDVAMVSDEDIDQPRVKKMSRSEKSKHAAKNRRDREALEFANLIDTLPVARQLVDKLDKSSIVRLIIAYMRIKHFLQREMAHICNEVNSSKKHVSLAPDTSTISLATETTPVKCIGNNVVKKCTELTEGICNDKNSLGEINESMLMLSALNGFLVLLDKKKTIMFVSENIEDYLGLPQGKVIGNHIKDFIHPDDIPELRKQYNLQTSAQSSPDSSDSGLNPLQHLDNQRLFYLRMKYCLARPGMKTQQSGYTLVQWSGKIKMRRSVTKALGYGVDCLLCICRPMQTNSILEIRMDGNMFMSRHDMGMRFTFCDSRIITLIGYEPSEVIGKTAYQFHNPLDAGTVGKCHSNLIVKGTSVSKYYRFIGKSCAWVWMQTRATIIYNTSNEPQYVVCMNYIISEEEGQRYLLMEQEAKTASCAKGIMDLSCSGSSSSDKQVKKIQSLDQIPQNPSTSSSGDHNEHSDGGYCSATSPYSSINPSPTGNHMDEDAGIVVTTDTNSQFPVTVLREVANTMNPSDPSDESAILDLIDSMNKETNQSSLDMVDRFGNFSGGSEWMDTQQDLQQNVYQQNQPSNLPSSYPEVTSPNQMSPQQQLLSPSTPPQVFNGDSRFDGSMNASVLSMQTGSPESVMSQGSMMSINEDSNMSNSSLQCSASGSSGTQLPSFQRLEQLPNGSSFCDLSLRTSMVSSLSGSGMQTVPLLPRNHSFPTLSQSSSALATSTGPLPQSGLLNIQIGALNTGNQSSVNGANGDALPSDLSDFCMEFCGSMSDRQAQQILEDLGGQKELLSTFEELRSQGNVKMTQSNKEQQMSFETTDQMNCNTQTTLDDINAQAMTGSAPRDISNCTSCGTTPPVRFQQFSSQMPPPSSFTVSKSHRKLSSSNHSDTQSNISGTLSQNLQYNMHGDAVSYLPHQVNSYNVNNMEQQKYLSQQQQASMSELEKMLRGYSHRTNGQCIDSCSQQSKCPSREISSPNNSTLLQQMLTGHLSGDCYHAMEKRRQATIGLRPKPQ